MLGATRPSMLPLLSDLILTFCHAGRGKTVLTPPPVAPPPPDRWPGFSHQVISLTFDPDCFNIVPPTPSAFGLELGKSIWAWLSLIWSPEPSSPDEMQAVMPSNRAALSRSSMACTAFADQLGSSSPNPQLHESATGLAVMTRLSKSTHPR